MRRSLGCVLTIVGVMLSSVCLANDWAWTLVQPGASSIGVQQGRAQVERKGNKFTVTLNSTADRLPSSVVGTLRNKRASGILTLSYTDSGPMLLEEGRWIVRKLGGGTIEKIWLHDPRNGHYLLLSRWVAKQQ